MAEKEFAAEPAPLNPPKPRHRKLFLLLGISAGAVVLLILAVLAAPTLISSGPVVGVALKTVNKDLNGKVDIASVSLGWFSGIKIDGLKVLDQQGSQIATLDHVVVPFPLWKAITAKFDLGDVIIDGVSFDARYDSQGQLNFSKLVKSEPTHTEPAAPSTTVPPKVQPAKLPTLSGHIKLTNVHGTISRPGKPSVYLTKLNGDVNIPDINSPITDQFDAAIKVADHEATLTASGTAAIITDNQINFSNGARSHQSVEIKNIDLQLASPFLPDSLGIQTLEGSLGFQLNADVQDRGNVIINSAITSQAPIAIGGTILKGDVFRTNSFSVELPGLTADLAQGVDQWKTARISVGNGSAPASLKIDQGEITLIANVIPQAFLNYLDGQKPGLPGEVALNSNFDLGKIIPQLKNTLPPPAGVKIDGGALTETLTVAITPEKLDLSEKTDTTQITGTQTAAGANPTPVAIDPIHFFFSASGQLVDPQNINLDLQSKFANGKFHGNSLTDLSGQLNADLKILQTQISQFVDLKKKTFSGTLAVNLADHPDAIQLDVTAKDVNYSDADQHFTQPVVQLSVIAGLQSAAHYTLDSLKKINATLKTGDANAPATDMTAEFSNLQFSSTAKSPLNNLQSAHFQINVPDIKPVTDLANAFSSTAAIPAAKADAKPAAPLKFSSGSAQLIGDLSHDGPSLKLNVSQITANNLATQKGEATYAFKPIKLALIASVDIPDKGSINKFDVSSFTGDLGFAAASMPTPISISLAPAGPVASGAIKVVGNLTDLTQLLAAIQGKKPDAYPYRGDYTLTENIGSQQSTISLKGGLQLVKFQSFNGDAVTFSEDLLSIANDVALTTANNDQSVTINSFTAAMQSSGAVKLALNNGTIQHLNHARELNLHPTVDYDLAKLWPVVQPMMGDKYKTLKIGGHYQKQFNITGSYPADQPSTVAIKPLHADGDLAVESFDYNGLTLQNFDVPFSLDNGQLMTVYANKTAAAPATANGGTLDLGNLTIDLTQSPPRLTTPQNKLVINNLTINPLFSDSFLAKVINNPLFAGAKDASGLFSLTIDDCNALPMGDLVTLPTPENTGKIDLHFSIAKLHIGLALDALQSVLKQNTFDANVNNATVAVAKGLSTQHIKFATGDYTLGFDGSVRLKDQALIPMTLTFPLAAIASKTHLVKDQNVLAVLPDSLAIPVEGTVSSPKYRFEKVIPKAVADATAKAFAKGLLGGNKNGNGNDDALGGLLNKLEKKKH